MQINLHGSNEPRRSHRLIRLQQKPLGVVDEEDLFVGNVTRHVFFIVTV